MSKTKTKPARLIVAASEQDPDMLYATKFWAPDPFIFLQRNGKRTLVLSDLESIAAASKLMRMNL